MIEGRVSQSFQARPETAQSASIPGQRHGHLDGLAEVERLESLLFNFTRAGFRIFRHDPPEIGAQFGNRNVVPDVNTGQSFGECGTIQPR